MTRRSTVLLVPVLLILLAGVSIPAPAPGRIPLDYPVVTTTAKAGDWVLAPPRLWLDQALAKGVNDQTFIFYGASMVKPGPAESRLKDLVGDEQTLPNSLIIPLRKGQKAAVGDILLSWWQSGSGLQRAIVLKGGTPTAPKVMYLDLDLDNPAGIGKKPDNLKPDTFHLLRKPMEPGTTMAIRDGAKWKVGQVVSLAANRVLYVGFAGRLGVASRKDCVGLPIRPPALKPGASVVARSSMDSMEPAKVVKVDAAIGRVFVTFPRSYDPKAILAVAFGDLIAKLP